MGFRSKNLGIRAKRQYLFNGDVPVLTGKLAIDISTKIISNLVYADPAQANTRTKIKIADSELPLVRSPKILGVYLDTFFSCNNHCVQVTNRVPTTPACTWWNRPEEDPSSGKLESTHPSRTSVKYDQFFLCRVNHACQRCLIRHPRCYYLDTRNFE